MKNIQSIPLSVWRYRQMITPKEPLHLIVCQTGSEIMKQANRNTDKKVKIDLA